MSKLTDQKQKLIRDFAKDAIYNAVVELFKEQGIEGVTIQNVAQKAGTATGTIYNYFKNKEEILEYVSSKTFQNFLDVLSDAIKDKKPVEKLRAFLKCSFEFFVEHRGTFKIIERAKLDDRIDDSKRSQSEDAVVQIVNDIIEEGVHKGDFRKTDVSQTAMAILSLVVGMTKLNISSNLIDPERDANFIISFVSPYLIETNKDA